MSPPTRYIPRCHAILSAVLDGRGGDDTVPLMVPVTPSKATVCRNSYHDADTWSIECNVGALPFDPEIVRSLAVVIYMYAVEDATSEIEWADPSFEMIRGLADDDEIKLSKDGQRLTAAGRDYTGILHDRPWDPRVQVPFGRPLDVQVQAIADAAAPPGARLKFQVTWEVSDEWGMGTPIVGRAQRSTKRKGLWVKPGKSTWDVIYEMVTGVGLICFVRGEEIVIRDPKIQTATTLLAAPRLVYGKNLSSLTAKRKLSREKVPQIHLTSFDPKTGQRNEILYPAEGEDFSDALGIAHQKFDAKGNITNDVMNLTAPLGITDRDTLHAIAKARFANLARAETSYKAETLHLQALDGEDLLRIDTGDAISIVFEPWNKEQMRALSEDARIDFLLDLGYEPAVAELIAEYFERLDQYKAPHYMTEGTFEFDHKDGLMVTLEGVNYAHEPREIARDSS